MREQVGPESVVHVSSAHPFTDNRIHYRECRSLSAAGYDVSLVATESDFDGESTGVTVIKLRRRRRLRRMIMSSAQAVRKALKTRARIVHLHDPELIPYIPLLRVMGRVVIYDAHEDLPVQIIDKPYTTKWTRGPLVLVTWAILTVARRANLIVAATEKIAERFPSDMTVLVRNFPPLRAEEEVLPDAAARENIAVYVGALSGTRGVVELLKAVDDPLFPEGWAVHLAGPLSTDVESLVLCAAETGRVVYHGQLSPLATRDLLLTAKVGIVTLRSTAAYRDSLPTKLFEYFAAGLPSVASDFPLWRSIIEPADSGVLVNERDPSAIAEAIAGYASSPRKWAEQSANARRQAVESLNWAPEGKALIDAYRRL